MIAHPLRTLNYQESLIKLNKTKKFKFKLEFLLFK